MCGSRTRSSTAPGAAPGRSCLSSLGAMPMRFVILGGGPAGNTAATHAARLGADVTVIERDLIGGAAHLCDCIPSKAMIATGGAMSFNRRIGGMGLTESSSTIDLDLVRHRMGEITERLQRGIVQLLE